MTTVAATDGLVLQPGQRRDPRTGEVQPWLTVTALAEIGAWDLADAVVLEWGAGLSTLWWARRCAGVTTVERDPFWCDWVRARAAAEGLDNVCVLVRPTLCSADEYTQLPRSLRPDVVVIDGVMRDACLVTALALARPITIVFDNWEREGAFVPSRARRVMRPYVGRSYPQPDLVTARWPWQTAIWHLT